MKKTLLSFILFAVSLNLCAQQITKKSDSPSLTPFCSGDKYGYINADAWNNDETIDWVISPMFDSAASFSDELAAVKVGNRYGYINKKGIYVIFPMFDEASDFFDGIATVKVNNQQYYIDKTGTTVFRYVNTFSYDTKNNDVSYVKRKDKDEKITMSLDTKETSYYPYEIHPWLTLVTVKINWHK